MEKVNIFQDNYNMGAGSFFSFKNVGDSVQGTFMGKKTSVNKFGNEQVLYKLKVNGETVLVAEMTTTHDKMVTVSPGQIVGFKYTGNAMSKRNGKEYKVVEVFADPSVVDKAWLEQNEDVDVSSAFGVSDPTDKEFEKTFGAPAGNRATPLVSKPQVLGSTQALEIGTTVDKKGLVAELAIKKFGGTEQEALEKLMNESGLAIVPRNYDALVDLLQ